MKIRSCYVSNSSSSSFICCLSGQEESGWDICLSEVGMYQCERGHVFSEKYFDGGICEDQLRKEATKWKLENDPEDKYDIEDIIEDISIEYRNDLPSNLCPICQLKYTTRDDVLRFMLHRDNVSFQEVVSKIYSIYGQNSEDFYDVIENVGLNYESKN